MCMGRTVTNQTAIIHASSIVRGKGVPRNVLTEKQRCGVLVFNVSPSDPDVSIQASRWVANPTSLLSEPRRGSCSKLNTAADSLEVTLRRVQMPSVIPPMRKVKSQ